MTIDMELKDRNLEKVKPRRDRIRKRNNSHQILNKNTPEYRKRKKKKTRIIALIIFLLAFGALAFLAYRGYIFSQELGFVFSPKSIIPTNQPKELQKDSSERYTSVLLVGLDTRENGGLLNTDSIILASYDYENDYIILISIPRDFHVEVGEGVKWFSRINSIYSSAEQKKQGSGIEALVRTVERLTGQEIQYHALVDFKAFVEVIDSVGGIDVNVENAFTDYMYPKGLGYEVVSFEAGPQTMDGETALKYSRSRHSPHNNEGTDFARARRQQRVLMALKDKLLTSESFTNPKTVMSILSSISGNLKVSDFTISDIEATFNLTEKYQDNNGKIYSFVLDPTVGAGLLVERKNLESGAYAIGPKLGLGEYEDIEEFLKLVRKDPQLYSEDPSIMVYDTGIGFQNAKEKTEELKEKLPYVDIVFAGTLFNDKEKTIVYSNKDAEETKAFPYTIKTLSKILKTDLTEKPEYITSNLNGQDVTILLGKETQLTEE
jgi:LCP family protein required for cell wall assembly